MNTDTNPMKSEATPNLKPNWAEFSSEEDDDYNDEETQQRLQNENCSQTPKVNSQSNNFDTKNANPFQIKKYHSNREGGDRSRPPMTNQLAPEMIQIIQNSVSRFVHIKLFNLHYDATPDEIYDFYENIQFNINSLGKGYYLAEFESKEEAIKFIEKGTGKIKGRPFYMKIYFSQRDNEKGRHYGDNYKKTFKSGYDKRPKNGGYADYSGRDHRMDPEAEADEFGYSFGNEDDEGVKDYGYEYPRDSPTHQSRGKRSRRGGKYQDGDGEYRRGGAKGGSGREHYGNKNPRKENATDYYHKQDPEPSPVNDLSDKFFGNKTESKPIRFVNTGRISKENTKPENDASPKKTILKENPFGQAKPIDDEEARKKKEKDAEEKALMEKEREIKEHEEEAERQRLDKIKRERELEHKEWRQKEAEKAKKLKEGNASYHQKEKYSKSYKEKYRNEEDTYENEENYDEYKEYNDDNSKGDYRNQGHGDSHYESKKRGNRGGQRGASGYRNRRGDDRPAKALVTYTVKSNESAPSLESTPTSIITNKEKNTKTNAATIKPDNDTNKERDKKDQKPKKNSLTGTHTSNPFNLLRP